MYLSKTQFNLTKCTQRFPANGFYKEDSPYDVKHEGLMTSKCICKTIRITFNIYITCINIRINSKSLSVIEFSSAPNVDHLNTKLETKLLKKMKIKKAKAV